MCSNVLILILLLLINIALIHAADYTCTAGQDCSITLNTYQSAYQSTITCPSNYNCDITCTDPNTPDRTDSYQICQETTIIASSSTTVTINCNGLENCQNLNFIGSNHKNANISINCNGINTCNRALFDFQSSPYISINCFSDGSCSAAEFDGRFSNEMYMQLNSINTGDDMVVYCGLICSIYSAYIQSNIMLYSNNILYGNVLQCDSENNCFENSKILCNYNYTDTCDIEFIDSEFKCDQCLNHIFTPYEVEVSMDYTSDESNTIKYRLRIQYVFYSSIIYLLSDETDQFSKYIEDECECIDEIDEHIGIFINTDMDITITTDLEIINIELNKLFKDGRFKYLFTANMAVFDDSFEINSIGLLAEKQTVDSAADEQIIQWITIVIVCILGIVLIIAIIGTIQMYAYDVTIYVTGILLFGLYTWDFYSDILFSYEVYIGYSIATENAGAFLALFIACLIFLIAPIIASIISLFRFQDKWKEDQSIGDHVTGWNRDWSTYLLILTILSGSSFAAVNILNSRVFGHPLFCMGLSYRHLKKFENQRLWGVIISENIPQLFIQGIYFYYSSQQFSNILVLAFVSSLLSIIVALIDIYNNKRLFGQFSNSDDYQTILKVPVISHEVSDKQWRLALATHRFNEVFSKIIGVDKYAIEVDLPSPNQNGLVINFSVRTVDINPKEIVDSMTRAQKNGAMAKFIQEAWNLEKTPLLGRLKFEQIGRKQTDIVMDTAIEMVNPLSPDGKNLALDDSVNTISFNNNDENDRLRTNTVEAKPYEDLDKIKKHKVLQRKKRTKTQSSVPEQALSIIPETRNIRSETVETIDTNIELKEDSIYSPNDLSDIPENITQTQTQLKVHSQSEVSLPRQPTGAHTKKMREMRKNLNESMQTTSDIKRKEIESPLSPVGKQIKNFIENGDNDKQTQFHQFIEYQGAAPSQPQLYQSNAPMQQNNRQNYAQSVRNLNQNNDNNMNGQRPQTYGQIPYTYNQTHQLPNNNTMMQQNQSFSTNSNSNYNMPNTQQQFQQNYGGYAASAFNLNQQQQQPNYQQQFQQNIQQTYSVSSTNVNNYNNNQQQPENDHTGFVPPSPAQEMDKYVSYKQKRQFRDEEKRLRRQQEKEMKRLENTSPNVINYSNQKRVKFVNNNNQINPNGNQY